MDIRLVANLSTRALKSYGEEEILAVHSAPDGSVYVGFGMYGPGLGLEHLVCGRWSPISATNLLGDELNVTALFLDHENTLWIGTLDQGTYRILGSRVDNFSAGDGLSDNYVQNIYVDSEGTIWVVTIKGVDNFRDMSCQLFRARQFAYRTAGLSTY